MNDEVGSKTDPDAALVSVSGGPSMIAHKIHVAVSDGPARSATAVVTTAGAVQEQTQIEQVIGKHLMVTGERPLEVVANGAYGLRERYEFLLKRGIRPNIPYHNARSKRRSEKEKVGFVYDGERGGYRCEFRVVSLAAFIAEVLI